MLPRLPSALRINYAQRRGDFRIEICDFSTTMCSKIELADAQSPSSDLYFPDTSLAKIGDPSYASTKIMANGVSRCLFLDRWKLKTYPNLGHTIRMCIHTYTYTRVRVGTWKTNRRLGFGVKNYPHSTRHPINLRWNVFEPVIFRDYFVHVRSPVLYTRIYTSRILYIIL